MARFSVRRTILIDADRSAVYSQIRDFRGWKAWSPWLIAEPDCELSYSQDGRTYGWGGKIVGAGEMTVVDERINEYIDCELIFKKPFKSTNSSKLILTDAGGGTELTWTMEGSLPFFLFWMKDMMAKFVGSDYERGLKMLKERIEKGAVHSKVAFPGVVDFPGCRYVGIRNSCTMDRIGESMEADFARLHQHGRNIAGLNLQGMLSIYHKWDFRTGTAEYTCAFIRGSSASEGSTPDGLTSGEIPAIRAYKVVHTGTYEHLGNAWASGMMHERGRCFRKDKSVDPFEVYENDPGRTAPEDLVTSIYFPAK